MKKIFTGPTKIGKELAKYKKRLERKSRSQSAIEDPRYRKAISGPERGIHSQMHALAKEISEYVGEPKKFAMYLGIIKNIGLRRSYQIFSKIRQSRNVKTPGKLFVYESAYQQRFQSAARIPKGTLGADLNLRRAMEIVKKPAEILTKKLEEIDLITPQLKKAVLKMKKTMKEASGIGLAANQVGLNMRLFVIDEELAKEYKAPSVYINPEVKPYSKQTEELEEGCLSIPETWLKIKRPKKAKVKSVDEEGKKHKFIAKGILARVLQHEYDHLQGVLITDKI